MLRGKKRWIGNGTFAGVMTTYAKDRATGNMSAFIVKRDSQGLRTEEMRNKTGLLTVSKTPKYILTIASFQKNNLLGAKGMGA